MTFLFLHSQFSSNVPVHSQRRRRISRFHFSYLQIHPKTLIDRCSQPSLHSDNTWRQQKIGKIQGTWMYIYLSKFVKPFVLVVMITCIFVHYELLFIHCTVVSPSTHKCNKNFLFCLKSVRHQKHHFCSMIIQLKTQLVNF